VIDSTIWEKEVGVSPEGVIMVVVVQQALNTTRKAIGNSNSALPLLVIFIFMLMSLQKKYITLISNFIPWLLLHFVLY
jgi:hypothetical protein